MRKKIFKYDIEGLDGFSAVKMPVGAEVLTVQAQQGSPKIWALVDPDAPLESRFFRLAATGHEIRATDDYEYKYIGTYQIFNGKLVFHVFELIGKNGVDNG